MPYSDVFGVEVIGNTVVLAFKN